MPGSGWPQRRLPLDRINEAYLYLTNRCAGGCKHCYARSSLRSDEVELSTGQWHRVLANLKNLGAQGVVLLGGDPFLREDWREIASYALAELALTVRIFYNGQVTGKQAAELARLGHLGNLYLLTSLDGPDAASNDTVRGQGNFQRTVAGIRNLLAVGIVPIVNTVVTSHNIQRLPAMARWLKDLGLDRQHLLLPVNRGRLRSRPELQPQPAELATTLLELLAASQEAGLFVDNFAAWRLRLGGSYDLCNAGYDLLAVGSDGRVYGCPVTVGDSVFVAGRLPQEDLWDIWQKSPVLQALRGHSCARNSRCRSCPQVAACGGDCMMYGYYQQEGEKGTGLLEADNPYCLALQRVFTHLQEQGEPAGVEQADWRAFTCC